MLACAQQSPQVSPVPGERGQPGLHRLWEHPLTSIYRQLRYRVFCVVLILKTFQIFEALWISEFLIREAQSLINVREGSAGHVA